MSWCGTCDYSHWPPRSPVVTKDGRQSPTLQFPGKGEEAKAPELRAVFKSCFGEACEHYNKKGSACHAGCVAIAEGLGLNPAEYLPALAYSYEPPKSDERRRRELLGFRLQQALQENIGRLPTEVWDYVAKDLVCEYATAAIPAIKPKTVFAIDLLEAVWAKFVEIDGVEYVKSVSNEQRPGDRLLWEKPNSPTGHVVYISEDHLGINEITNHPQFTQPAQSKAVLTWWRTVPAEDSSTIGFETDGLKLQSFSDTALLPEVKWAYPMTPDEINGMALYYTMLDREAKLMPVDINAPDTIGYSVGWHYGCVYLHAHKRGESMDFYHEADMRQTEVAINSAMADESERDERRAVKVARVAAESDIEWTYHPLNAGEAIEQVWIRQPRELPEDEADDDDSPYGPRYLWSESPRDIAIGLVTNQSRTLVFGLQVDRPDERFPWRCIAKSSTASPMRIFFSYSLDGINLFAAPKSIASDEEPIPQDLYQQEPTNFFLYGCDFHTSASLKDVAQVVPCKVFNQGKPYVHGLLFRYKDGSERTVGKFRLDCAQPPISFDDSQTLCLGIDTCGSPRKHGEYVVDVGLSAPENSMWKKFSADEPLQWSWRERWTRVSAPSREYERSP